jgi:ABC-type glycerol-3-phosphate transport system permease component
MALTSIKPDDQLLDLDKYNPFWTWNPTFKHIHKLLFESYYPHWLWNTMYVAVGATVLSIIASVLAAYAIVRLRYRGAQWVGGAIFLAYLVPPSILFIPLATVVVQFGLFDSPLALKQQHTERKVDVIRDDGERLVFDLDDTTDRAKLAALFGHLTGIGLDSHQGPGATR